MKKKKYYDDDDMMEFEEPKKRKKKKPAKKQIAVRIPADLARAFDEFAEKSKYPKVDVAEAAVVGKTDETTGQAIAAFVILRAGIAPSDVLVEELRAHVSELIGPIAKPKSILFTDDLPKTRSGKIMRRLLRDVAEDKALGDTTTLADPSIVAGIKAKYSSNAEGAADD